MTRLEFRRLIDQHWPALSMQYMAHSTELRAIKAISEAVSYLPRLTSTKDIDAAFLGALWTHIEGKIKRYSDSETDPRPKVPNRAPLSDFLKYDEGGTW